MAKLKFDVALVEKLIDHAATTKEHNPSFAQLMDNQYAKPGAKPSRSAKVLTAWKQNL